mgnify:FL=1
MSRIKRIPLLRNSEVNKTDTKFSRTVVSSWADGREQYHPDNQTTLVDAFKDWVYVCSSRNASTVAKTPFKLFLAKRYNGRILVPTRSISKKTKDYVYSNQSSVVKDILSKAVSVEEIIDHPFLQLMRKVNPFIEGFTLLELTQLYLELTGNAYWYVYANEFGVPLQLWVLPSQHVKIIPSKNKFIEGYTYTIGMDSIPFDISEIIHFKFPNPKNLYYGKAPASAIVDVLNTNENMNKYENSLFSNNCRPEGILQTESELSSESFERLKKDWKENYSGTNRVGKVAILEKGLKYSPITFPPKDLSFPSGRKYNKELVAGAYGIPLSMLATEGATLGNAYVQDKQYASYTIVPRLARLEEGINGRLLSRYDSTIFFLFADPVPENAEFELIKRVAEVKAGIRTINEIRAEDGLEDVEWGDLPPAKNTETVLDSIKGFNSGTVSDEHKNILSEVKV